MWGMGEPLECNDIINCKTCNEKVKIKDHICDSAQQEIKMQRCEAKLPVRRKT